MLAGRYRLRGTYYIKRAKEKGRLYQFDNFGMSVYKRDNKAAETPSRFVVIVSTKIAKHAVDRNRIKRMITEAVRFESNNLVLGCDVAFLTKPSILRTPTDTVMKEVKKALETAKLITSETSI